MEAVAVCRWDDIEILKYIDARQTEHSGQPLWTDGRELMNDIAGSMVTEFEEWRGFVQELHMARDAGLLVFETTQYAGGAPLRPETDPYYYLQQLRDFALTVKGRDRARGRLVAQSVPDASEDDGRLISSLIIKQIAAAVSEMYEPDQAQVFLREAGIPPEGTGLPENVRAGDLLDVLTGVYRAGSAGRRALRSFIGRWLDDQLISGPSDEQRSAIVEQLARQGWYVKNGNLVIDEPTRGARTTTPILRDARLAALHPLVVEVATPYFGSGHRATAVFEAMKAVNNRVKAMAAIDADGIGLMGRAFADNSPALALGDLSTQTGRNIHAGFRFLFMGALQAIRNPSAHERFETLSENEALEQLGLASLLMRRLDLVASYP